MKQLYYVKTVPYTPLQKLDLNRAEDEDFSPDKLRAKLERFYTYRDFGLDQCCEAHYLITFVERTPTHVDILYGM